MGARTRGKAIAERKAYMTAVLAYLATRPNGATPEELADAMGITPAKAREYARIVREWLGTNPRTGDKHLPDARQAPAARTRGVAVYQVQDLLVDADLFRRLRARGQSLGTDGIADLSRPSTSSKDNPSPSSGPARGLGSSTETASTSTSPAPSSTSPTWSPPTPCMKATTTQPDGAPRPPSWRHHSRSCPTWTLHESTKRQGATPPHGNESRLRFSIAQTTRMGQKTYPPAPRQSCTALGGQPANEQGDFIDPSNRGIRWAYAVRGSRQIRAAAPRRVSVRARGDTGTVSSSYWDFLQPPPPDPSRAPIKVSVRTFGQAVEEALMSYTRVKLQTILEDELALEWQLDYPPVEAHTKRDLIQGYTSGWKVAQLAGLARRVVTELDVHDSYLVDLRELLATFDAGGGVEGPTKNLIFAANGPKPESDSGMR